MFEFNLSFGSMGVDEKCDFQSKTVLVTPRNVFYNASNDLMQVRQFETDNVVLVAAGERKEIWWGDGRLDPHVQFKSLETR
jgi:hypothetical protein